MPGTAVMRNAVSMDRRPSKVRGHPPVALSDDGRGVPDSDTLAWLPAVMAVPSTAICADGWVSYSAHRQGTCSHHGGVAAWQ